MWKFAEHAYLLLSHVNPRVLHRDTPECLICRRQYAAERRVTPNVIANTVGQRYPSENELLATDNFSPKYLTYSITIANDPVIVQLRYTFHFMHYSDAGLACSLRLPGRVAAPSRTRNAVVVVGPEDLPDTFGSVQQLILFLSGGSWVQCDKLVVFGYRTLWRDWSRFVTGVKSSIAKDHNNHLIQNALFILLRTTEHSKNFLSWLQYTNGRVSIRTLLQHQILDFDVWGFQPSWDISFFV